jgi:hypothetical protein
MKAYDDPKCAAYQQGADDATACARQEWCPDTPRLVDWAQTYAAGYPDDIRLWTADQYLRGFHSVIDASGVVR